MSAHLNETRLLAVDDNPDNRDVLSRGLKRLGYEHVLCAVDGEEALTMSAAAPFDAMLLDVMMPRKGGVEVRITVAGHARGGIVLGRHHPVHRVTGPIDHCLVRLALWPARSGNIASITCCSRSSGSTLRLRTRSTARSLSPTPRCRHGARTPR
jgi:hypothetical protein